MITTLVLMYFIGFVITLVVVTQKSDASIGWCLAGAFSWPILLKEAIERSLKGP